MSANRGPDAGHRGNQCSAARPGQGAAAAEIVQLEICHERCEARRCEAPPGPGAGLIYYSVVRAEVLIRCQES